MLEKVTSLFDLLNKAKTDKRYEKLVILSSNRFVTPEEPSITEIGIAIETLMSVASKEPSCKIVTRYVNECRYYVTDGDNSTITETIQPDRYDYNLFEDQHEYDEVGDVDFRPAEYDEVGDVDFRPATQTPNIREILTETDGLTTLNTDRWYLTLDNDRTTEIEDAIDDEFGTYIQQVIAEPEQNPNPTA